MQLAFPVPRVEIPAFPRDDVMLLAVLAAVVLLPLPFIIATFIIVGQSHFLMTFIYQYRGGKMNHRYLLVAAGLALGIVAYFVFVGEVVPVAVVAGLGFAAHFARDEFYLRGERLDVRAWSTIAGFLLVFFATATASILGPGLGFLPLLVTFVVLGGMCVRVATHRPPSATERYLWIAMLLIVALSLAFGLAIQILAAVSLLHCLNWMVGYGRKVRPDAVRRAGYWRATALTFLLSVSLYFLWSEGGVGFLQYFFLLTYWYVGAIAHFVLTSTVVSGAKRPLSA